MAHYTPGLQFAVDRAYEAYTSAWRSEDAAAGLCDGEHCHPDGDRIELQGQCQVPTPAGRAHTAAWSALADARRVHDYLKELSRRETDGRAAAERALRVRILEEMAREDAADQAARDDELTALAAAVFTAADEAFRAGTVAGRSPAAQKRADAIAPGAGFRS